jgi:hypothetical protein
LRVVSSEDTLKSPEPAIAVEPITHLAIFDILTAPTLPPQALMAPDLPQPWLHPVAIAWAAVALLNLNNLSRLWLVDHSDHSPFTFSRPRKRKRLSPRASFVWPKDGFDDRLSSGIGLLALLASELATHQALGINVPGDRKDLVMAVAVGRA